MQQNIINKDELIKRYIERSNYHFSVINDKPILLRNSSSIPLWKEKYPNTDFATAYYQLDDYGTQMSVMFWDLRHWHPQEAKYKKEPQRKKKWWALSILLWNKEHDFKYRIFWSWWYGETIEFKFDKVWHEVYSIPEDYQGAEKEMFEEKLKKEQESKKGDEKKLSEAEIKQLVKAQFEGRSKEKWFTYVWDMTPVHAKFIFESLSPYVKRDKLIIALPSEQYTLLKPWEEAGYTTIGIDINEKTADMRENFFDLTPETWKNWSGARSNYKDKYNSMKEIGLIISYLPSFMLPWSQGDSRVEWFKHIVEVWGKTTPMCIRSSGLFTFYTLTKMITNLECPPISQKISLPRGIAMREVGQLNELLLFNLPQVERIMFDGDKYDYIDKIYREKTSNPPMITEEEYNEDHDK